MALRFICFVSWNWSSFLLQDTIPLYKHTPPTKDGYLGCLWVLLTRPRFDLWVGKIPWRGETLPTPVIWPGEFHGLWGRTKSDSTEQLSLCILTAGNVASFCFYRQHCGISALRSLNTSLITSAGPFLEMNCLGQRKCHSVLDTDHH